MSFLDDIVSFGSSAIGYLKGDGIGSSLARTALTAYALNKVSQSAIKKNSPSPTPQQRDGGVRLQIFPNADARVPVIYGTAITSAIVTDAEISNSNATMYFCLTLCERTGNTELGQGAASEFKFKRIFWDDNLLEFDNDGITVKAWVDRDGNRNTEVANFIKVYCYAGSSTEPVVPAGYSNSSLGSAFSVMPNWTTQHQMSDLVFAIVRVDYDAISNIKGLGTMKFEIQNTMKQPGDCLYDYMTNTRYGAGIDATEIYSQ